MGDTDRLPLPLRADAARWMTVRPRRTVLGVVHNITSATRLVDLLAVFSGDERVQVVFTCTESSALDGGTGEFLRSRGMLMIPWDVAESEKFDLALATSRGGNLHKLRFPLIGTPHGAGYNKVLSREPGAGSREPGACGLSEEWLLHGGEVVPSVIVLSHEEQLERLASSCPQAVPSAFVAGDPCMDQLRAGLPFRETYRRALGLRPGQQLVVVSSTWGPGSVLGSPQSEILRRTLAELPAEEFRVLAALHPNAYHGHGAWQIYQWLGPLIDSGLMVPPPESDTWKAALCAADFLIGDHGSLTMYGSALGIPALFGAYEAAKVAPHSPMERLGGLLPRLSRAHPLHPQLTAAVRGQRDDPRLSDLARTVTSEPGRAAELLRGLFYTWLRLEEPEHPATTAAVPVPARPVGPRTLTAPYEEAMFVTARITSGAGSAADEITLRRYPAAHQHGPSPHLASAHLSADRDDPDRSRPRTADVVLVPRDRVSVADADPWCAYEAAASGCGLLAEETADGGCLAYLRGGRRLRVRWLRRPDWAGFALAASAVHGWATTGDDRASGRASVRLVVRAGELPEAGLLEISGTAAHETENVPSQPTTA